VTARSWTQSLLLKGAIATVVAGAIVAVVHVLLASTGGVIELSWAGKPVELLRPQWFYLLAGLPYFYFVRVLSLTDVSFVQQVLATTLRGAVFAILALALTRPVWKTADDKIATVALVDVSQSVSDQQLQAARDYVGELIKAKRGDDSVFVVTFAERPRVAPLKEGAPVIERHQDESLGTNIQAAMQLGYGLFPDDALPRLVILSDGNQTEGDILVEAYRAEELGVKVSWKSFPEDRNKEIRVAALTLPDEVKVGAPFEVAVEVWSTHPDEITLALRQDDFPNPLEPQKTVQVVEGKNRFKFKSEAKRPGHTTYTVRITKAGSDSNPGNNSMVMTTPVKGQPRILYVEGGILRDRSVATYIQRALEHENMMVDVRGPQGLPSSPQELRKYDLVMVSDVPAHFMGMAQMNAIERYVRDFGGGFVMAGGEDSFGSGGYQGTTIEKILPVRFDSEKMTEQATVAIMLVIDRSGSMQGAKIEAAKESARATAEVLSPNDLIGVIGFDSQPTTIVRVQKASNRMRISSDISRLTAGGGTNIYPALQEAYQTLQNVNAKVKHVILLSDGHAPEGGIAELCQEMVAARITVSAVGIGDAQRSLLKMIVDNGQGRLYMTDNISSLPRIFMKETTEAKKSSLVEDRVYARIAKRVEMIEGTSVDKAPPLLGYVSTKPKPMGEVILVSDLGEPLLARWRLGTGTTVAWTSDVKNRWSVEWIRWPGYPKFWAQLVRTTMRRKVYDSYDLSASVQGGVATVVVDAIDDEDRFVNELTTKLEIIDPKDGKTTRTIDMPQAAAGRYEANFDIDRYGSYLVKAIHQRNGKTVAESMGAVTLPYPEEFLRTSPNPEPLAHAAMVTHGTSDAAPAQLFAARETSVEYREDLWPWLLLLAMAALVLDTYFKRVRLFGYRTIEF